MIAGIPGFSTDSHRSWGEVLNLLKMEVKSLGLHGKLCHILLKASRMATYEERYYLLVQILLLVDTIEDALEFLKL